MILQQHVYKFCIDIDLVNDNKYWTVLINNATRECSIDPILRAHSYGQTKIQLQLWNYKTSYKQLPVPIRYVCDGLEHIPPWFKP
jgi:hypothetical protein